MYVTDDRSVQGIEHDILQTGLLTGHGAASHRLYTEMQRKIAAIRSTYAGDPEVPVFVDRGYFYTIGPQSLAADLISMAGGQERGRRRRHQQAVRPGQAARRRRRRCTWPWRPAA